MAAPTPQALEKARLKVEQAKARLQALEARASAINRKQDARRKIILGGLLLDAAMKDPAWEKHLRELMSRISRDQDKKAFDGWTFAGSGAPFNTVTEWSGEADENAYDGLAPRDDAANA